LLQTKRIRIIILTGTLIFDEIELQSLFECIFVDIIFHTDPGTREKQYFKNWFTSYTIMTIPHVELTDKLR
jgi:hypothetical protein